MMCGHSHVPYDGRLMSVRRLSRYTMIGAVAGEMLESEKVSEVYLEEYAKKYV